MSQIKVLKSRDIPGLAEYIASDKCKNIVLMLGAGVSTSAGIPDFRSPDTGLYANLARLRLPYPEAVFDIRFFRNNPEPFYTLAQELYPGRFRPTIAHSFVRLLAAHSLLHTCFTQNIDTLETIAGVPADKVIEAHGSFASQRCIDCHRPYDDDKMKVKILAMETPKCETCGGLVKPDIVFFGEDLPDEFIKAIPNVAKADLLIIMGTSLTVHPFAGLAERTGLKCPRVLINLEVVGSIGRRPNDIVLLGKCDDAVEKLCKELGWEEELNALWAKTAMEPAWKDAQEAEDEGAAKEAATTDDLVRVITDAIGRKLKLDEAAESKESAADEEETVALNEETNAVKAEESPAFKAASKEEPTATKEEESTAAHSSSSPPRKENAAPNEETDAVKAEEPPAAPAFRAASKAESTASKEEESTAAPSAASP